MSADKRTLRVYLVTHRDGHVTGLLLRTWETFFDRSPPSAYGTSEEDVLEQLKVQVQVMAAMRDDTLDRYLWDESFEVRTVAVGVHPQVSVRRTAVVGRRRIPLVLTYLAGRSSGGGFRVLVPRFGFRFFVEDLSIAAEVIEHAVSTALLGESPRLVYDFRAEGEERVREWWLRVEEPAPRPSEDEEGFASLRRVAEDLVARAAKRGLPPVVGDSEELERTLPLVSRAPPASLLVVGGPGAGKTTFVHRLARRFLQWKRDKRPAVPRLWSTTADRLLAGTTYLGMWQERCLEIIGELEGEGDYLYTGALLPLLRPQPDGASLADAFLPALRSGEISLIAECTDAELAVAERRAASFVGSFQVVRIPEPPSAAVPALLAEYEERLHARTRLHPAAKKRLIQHLSMFRRDVCFPGKAFRFMDFLGQEGDAGKPSAGQAPRWLLPRELSQAYARWSGLPMELVADEIPSGSAAIAARLSQRIIGQDGACAAAARVIARFKAGMNDPERPAGALLFVGPTGVGKTHLAKELSRAMFGDEARMIRLDMSEYASAGSARRLLEARPGASTLASRVRGEPLSLVLFDEIEKADEEVLDVLLGILGEGRLTDEDGRLVDFRMTLIAMTSNLGVAATRPLGFGEIERSPAIAAVREHFRPEMWNRIDYVIPFRSLDGADVLRIVDLSLSEVERRTGLLRRNLRLRVTPAARARLAALGYRPEQGARPLKRVIEERVITRVAARMAADPAFADREIVVDVGAGEEIVVG